MSGSARSGCRVRNEADPHPSPPIIVLAAVWRADRPSPIILPDRCTDAGEQSRPPVRVQPSSLVVVVVRSNGEVCLTEVVVKSDAPME